MTSAFASPAAIKPPNWVHQQKFSFTSGLPLGFNLPSRKLFSLTANQNKKDPFLRFQVSCSLEVERALVQSVASKVEKTKLEFSDEIDASKNIIELDLKIATTKDVKSTPKTSTANEKNPKKLSSSAAQSYSLDYTRVIRYPLMTDAAVKLILERNTLVFVVDKNADKNIIKEAVTKMLNIKAKKVNTSITPDGTKKAFVMLAPECSAVDIAKMIKVL